jgi:hypothetical protein
MTDDGDEIAGLDGGAFGGGVRAHRRGLQRVAPQAAAGTVPVCRFFTTPGTFGTKSSHFYTANQAECDLLKLNPSWIYEKIAFYIATATRRSCPAARSGVPHVQHGQTGAPNHRFTTSLATYQQFTSTMGWEPRRASRFCSPP